MEEVVAEVTKVEKAIRLLQTMPIVSLNMGNLTLGVNTLQNGLIAGEKEKAMLQEELDKEKDFQKRYEHNVEIWRKSKVEVELKNKLQDENEELKGSTTQLKSHHENMQNLRQKAEIWKPYKRSGQKHYFLIRDNRRLWIVK
jgi:hypothetical protein